MGGSFRKAKEEEMNNMSSVDKQQEKQTTAPSKKKRNRIILIGIAFMLFICCGIPFIASLFEPAGAERRHGEQPHR